MTSRQYEWQKKMKEAGRCIECGSKRLRTKLHCYQCAVSVNAYQRDYRARTANQPKDVSKDQ